MNKVTKAVIGTAVAAGAVSFGAGYIIFNEVMNRDAKLFGKIAGKVDAKSETAAKLPPESEDESYSPEEQTGDYDYDYSYAGAEVESFVSAKDEEYTDDYDYYSYGYGENHEAEELVVAPEEGEDAAEDALGG